MSRRRVLSAINALLTPLGIELTKTRRRGAAAYEPAHDPSSSYMDDSKLRQILIDELTDVGRSFFTNRLSDIGNRGCSWSDEVKRFLDLYSARPFRDNRGGSGFHNAFWIFLFARALNPRLIVESGVWRGHTSWLLEQACPDAEIHGFDTDLSRLEHKSGRIVFHEQDWSEHVFEDVDSDASLVFFDCHVSHARRIREAGERGFRHLVLDDNPPLHKLYGYGLPGFPTASVVFETPVSTVGDVTWFYQGRKTSRVLDETEILMARKRIERHEVFPDVGGPTRYGGFSFLTYLRVRST